MQSPEESWECGSGCQAYHFYHILKTVRWAPKIQGKTENLLLMWALMKRERLLCAAENIRVVVSLNPYLVCESWTSRSGQTHPQWHQFLLWTRWPLTPQRAGDWSPSWTGCGQSQCNHRLPGHKRATMMQTVCKAAYDLIIHLLLILWWLNPPSQRADLSHILINCTVQLHSSSPAAWLSRTLFSMVVHLMAYLLLFLDYHPSLSQYNPLLIW